MKKIVFGNSEFIIGEGFELLRVWRKLKKTCWTYYRQEPKVNSARIYAIRVIPAGEGQSCDWPELEWLTSDQVLAEGGK